MTHRLRFAARSDRGLVRSNNEDSLYAGDRLLIVADGMGGHAAGDIASRLVVAAFAPLDDREPTRDLTSPMKAAVREGNAAILELVAEDPELDGMGTTATAMLFDGPRMALAHIGDSRAYLYRNAVLHQLSHDDTFVQSLVDEGRITEEEAAHHPQRNLVLRAINGGDQEPAVMVREISPGDRFLLCSDGLSSVVSAEVIAETLANPDPDATADALIQLALVGGGPDNITVIVADVLDVGPVPATTPAGIDDPDATGPIQPIHMTQRMPRVPLPALVDVPAARPDYVDDDETDDFDDEYDDELDDDDFPDDDDESADDDAAEGSADGEWAGTGKRDAKGKKRPASSSPPPRGRRWGRRGALILALVTLLGVGLAGSLLWVRTQYFVGADQGQVVVYRGVDGSVLGIQLASVAENSCTNVAGECLPLTVADLVPAAREQVLAGITVTSLDDARGVITRLTGEVLPPCDLATPTAGTAPPTGTAPAATTAPSTTGPSTAGPSAAGPSTAGPSTAGPSTAAPSATGQSGLASRSAGSVAAPSSRKPTTSASKTAQATTTAATRPATGTAAKPATSRPATSKAATSKAAAGTAGNKATGTASKAAAASKARTGVVLSLARSSAAVGSVQASSSPAATGAASDPGATASGEGVATAAPTTAASSSLIGTSPALSSTSAGVPGETCR